MFDGIKPKTFLNTHQEWHAYLIGFCVGFCPWIPELIQSANLRKLIKGEEHYFVAGAVPGFIALLLILIFLAKLVETLWR